MISVPLRINVMTVSSQNIESHAKQGPEFLKCQITILVVPIVTLF